MGVLPEKILLATDGSEDAARATEAASDLASKCGAELHVVHVWHEVRGFAHNFVKGELKRQGQEVLDEQVEKIRSAGGEVAKAHLRGGRTSYEVITLGAEIGAGLLVVGSRGLGTVQRILMGSQSEEIVHHARSPSSCSEAHGTSGRRPGSSSGRTSPTTRAGLGSWPPPSATSTGQAACSSIRTQTCPRSLPGRRGRRSGTSLTCASATRRCSTTGPGG